MNTIFHLIETTGPGGAETISVQLAAGLDRARFRSRPAVVGFGWAYDALRQRGLEPSVVRLGHGAADWRFLSRIVMSARRQGATLMQSHLLDGGLYTALAARLLRLPAVVTLHGAADFAPVHRWTPIKVRLLAASTSRLVFVSDALRRDFGARCSVPDDRTVVIPNGLDVEAFGPAPHPDLRKALAVRDDAVLVGLVGNIRPAKAYDELLRVADRLRDNTPTVHFVVAGATDHPLFDRLVAERRDLRLEDRVTFAGFQKDVAAFLNGIDLCLNTSTSEGFSLSTIQAMACGVPVVATLSGGPGEIVTDGGDGVLVPVRDTTAIATAVAGLAADPLRRRRLGEAGRRTVLQRFTLRAMISAYEAVYEEEIGRSARGPAVRQR